MTWKTGCGLLKRDYRVKNKKKNSNLFIRIFCLVMAWRLSIKQYDNTTFKDEETEKSKVGRLKTEVLIEEDGIGESWGH